jgi:hypothetical protein
VEERTIVSEEQNQNEQVPAKDRPVKTAQEFTLNAHKSYWPLALAIALCFVLVGVTANNLIVLGIGTVLAAAAIIGWGLERR